MAAPVATVPCPGPGDCFYRHQSTDAGKQKATADIAGHVVLHREIEAYDGGLIEADMFRLLELLKTTPGPNISFGRRAIDWSSNRCITSPVATRSLWSRGPGRARRARPATSTLAIPPGMLRRSGEVARHAVGRCPCKRYRPTSWSQTTHPASARAGATVRRSFCRRRPPPRRRRLRCPALAGSDEIRKSHHPLACSQKLNF